MKFFLSFFHLIKFFKKISNINNFFVIKKSKLKKIVFYFFLKIQENEKEDKN